MVGLILLAANFILFLTIFTEVFYLDWPSERVSETTSLLMIASDLIAFILPLILGFFILPWRANKVIIAEWAIAIILFMLSSRAITFLFFGNADTNDYILSLAIKTIIPFALGVLGSFAAKIKKVTQ